MSFVDITLQKNNRTYHDIDFLNGDLKSTSGFESALNMSIFCERRAAESEVAAPEKRRGWLGNESLDISNFEIGSKLWLLSQARANNITLNKAKTFVAQAVQWFIDDGYLDKIQISNSYSSSTTMDLQIKLIRSQDIVFSKGYRIWENTIEELNI